MGALEIKVISSLAVLVAGSGGSLAWRRTRHWRRYHGLAGTYTATRKVTHEHEADLVIKTKGNVLEVYYANLPEGDWVRGNITMTGDRGEGGYTNMNDGQKLWGEWTARLDSSDEIHVDRTYTSHKTQALVVTAFEWRRTGRPRRRLPGRS